MAEETTDVALEESATDTAVVSEGVGAPAEVADAAAASSAKDADTTEDVLSTEPASEPLPVKSASEAAPVEAEAPATLEASAPQEPDEIQPFVDRAFETIQHEVEHKELNAFLRAHVKTFREEWDIWPDSAKDVYMHMMTSQLLQRKASSTRIMNYQEFKLPVPSAQTKLFESIKQSLVKPKKCMPVLLLPPNLRPTYSLKK